MSEIGTINNNDKILKVAEDYYNKMEEAYKEALSLNKDDGMKLYRKKMSENKTTNFTLVIPDWLKLCIESNDAVNLEIIKKDKRKEKVDE